MSTAEQQSAPGSGNAAAPSVHDDDGTSVAVIVVHGVGEQDRGETARAITKMLARNPNDVAGSIEFQETKLVIPVRTEWLSSSSEQPAKSPDPDVAFSERALQWLIPDDEILTYETSVQSSNIPRSENESARKVDVYELYWNDLSHAPGFFVGFLAQLYQLFFHLSSLGRKAVLFASRSMSNDNSQNRLRRYLMNVLRVHEMIEWLLPGAIPVANLFLLSASLPVAVTMIPHDARAIVASGFATIVMAVMTVMAGVRLKNGAVGVGLSVTASLASGLYFVSFPAHSTAFLIAVILLIGLIAAYVSSAAVLNRYKLRVVKYAPIIAAVITIGLVTFGIFQPDSTVADSILTDVLRGSAFAVYGIFGLLQFLWLALFVLILVIAVSPDVARIAFRLPRNDAIVRALQTGRIGVLLSAVLFFTTTTVLWAALLDLSAESLNEMGDIYHEAGFGLLYPSLGNVSDKMALGPFSEQLYQLTIGHTANAFLASFLFALFIVLIGILPSAYYEVFPGSAEKATKKGATCNGGRWLNGAFCSMRAAEWILMLAWIVLASGYWILDVSSPIAGNGWVTKLGTGIAATIPALLLLKAHLPRSLKALLGILLDVSNWLQERPFSQNPRGRILCRFLSLLAHLSKGRYRRIVIVSHSQGAIITADCLRLLHSNNTVSCRTFGGRKPCISLMTAGAPIRQLYAERFPHQYEWGITGPNPCDFFGVDRWINVYRSGDYIGRSLWLDPVDQAAEAFSVDRAASVSATQDICIGAGAHTHYFDGIGSVFSTCLRKEIAR